jgi:hypothetical protein
MSNLFPMSYQLCIDEPERVTVASSIKCLKVIEVLKWLAVIGRRKDLDKVESVLPMAEAVGLLNDTEKELVLNEANVSKRARAEYYAFHGINRYLARFGDAMDGELFTAPAKKNKD